jgi:bZIP transcription factor
MYRPLRTPPTKTNVSCLNINRIRQHVPSLSSINPTMAAVVPVAAASVPSSRHLAAAAAADPDPNEAMMMMPTELTAEQQARKRRREYLSSQRGSIESLLDEALGMMIPTSSSSSSGMMGGDVGSPSMSSSSSSLLMTPSETPEEDSAEHSANKKCKVSEDEASASSYLSDDNESLSPRTAANKMISSGRAGSNPDSGNSSNGKKKAQMKYDPDVPMTKEEAAAWRREQRRKRNRESAAASRQRQRDRIDELERELGSWKAMYGDVMDKIKQLEGEGADVSTEDIVSGRPSTPITTTVVPTAATTVTPRASPTASPRSDFNEAKDDELSNDKNEATALPMVPQGLEGHEDDKEEQGLEGLLPTKMLSRPAVS